MDSFSFYYNDCDVELFPKEVTEQIKEYNFTITTDTQYKLVVHHTR